MIERDKIASIVKSCLPGLKDEAVIRIAEDIVRDVESIAYSLIRQTVAQEREQLYRNNLKAYSNNASAGAALRL
jgi:F420-0:gamma-glutamyl ligase